MDDRNRRLGQAFATVIMERVYGPGLFSKRELAAISDIGTIVGACVAPGSPPFVAESGERAIRGLQVLVEELARARQEVRIIREVAGITGPTGGGHG